MWGNLSTFLVRIALRSATLSSKDRGLLTGAVLEKLSALPLRDIITATDEGEILINGQPLDIEKARTLREFAKAALNNQALKLIQERVIWSAIRHGFQGGTAHENLNFYRAAVWFGEQQVQHLKTLAGLAQDQEPTL